MIVLAVIAFMGLGGRDAASSPTRATNLTAEVVPGAATVCNAMQTSARHEAGQGGTGPARGAVKAQVKRTARQRFTRHDSGSRGS